MQIRGEGESVCSLLFTHLIFTLFLEVNQQSLCVKCLEPWRLMQGDFKYEAGLAYKMRTYIYKQTKEGGKSTTNR